MRPILFRIPGVDVPIHAYGVMVVVGFILAISVASRRARARALDPNLILDLGIYVIIFGVLGARIWFVLQFRDEFDFAVLNIFDGRLSIIGAFVGAVAAILLYLYRGRMDFLGRLRGTGKGVKVFFFVSGILFVAIFSRAFYCFLDREAAIHIAYVNEPSFFYQESLRREFVEEPQIQGGAGRRIAGIPVVRVLGRRSSGPEQGKIDVVSYEFPKFVSSGSEMVRFRPADVAVWLALHNQPILRLQPAFSYEFIEIWKGGLVYFGGIIGAVLGGILFSFRRGTPFWKLADVVAPGAALGLAAGRVGCFLNGCCWGKIPESMLPSGTNCGTELARRIVGKAIPVLTNLTACFPHKSNAFNQHIEAGLLSPDATHSHPVYLTQLYESASAIALFLILLALSKYRKRDGEEILFFGMLYAIVRFLIELLRADNAPEYLFGLTISQSTAIFVFLFCLSLFILRRVTVRPIDSPEPGVQRREEDEKRK